MLDVQAAAIPTMKRWTKPQDHYVAITPEGNLTIPFREGRALLAQIGISGEILHTPGHSEDSVSLLLAGSSVFTGDLPPESAFPDDPVVLASWRLLRYNGARRVYPAHGPVRDIGRGGAQGRIF